MTAVAQRRPVPSHLEDLPRWRGLPVPFVNRWSSEADEHQMTHGPDATVGMEGWFSAGTQGEGEADFTRQCPQRQRLVTRYGLCQVCTAPVGRVRNVVALAGKIRFLSDGSRGMLIGEPWLCDPCVDYVRRVCPGVRQARPVLLRVHDWKLSIALQWHDDYGPDVQAAMWLNIVPIAARQYQL